ncbi:uncharacterized protein LOC6558529 isoform X2 [Drosophila grimshawi]|uniref:uncharacterized protein LOC6558529 isoform X2 n=1 Tax=Drosophila grimshawi TaxID=7222 RepID=UPI000C86EBCD|nr:uncharacterized protein LOC6558529 isoform X2 [Drosophila grimshawi]
MFSFAFWRNEAKRNQHENVSQFWKDLNATFVTLLGWSWVIYTIAVIIITICAYFAYCDSCQRTETVRRRRFNQRTQDRLLFLAPGQLTARFDA